MECDLPNRREQAPTLGVGSPESHSLQGYMLQPHRPGHHCGDSRVATFAALQHLVRALRMPDYLGILEPFAARSLRREGMKDTMDETGRSRTGRRYRGGLVA